MRLAASSLINTLAAVLSLVAAFFAVMTPSMTLALAAVAVQPVVVMVGAVVVQRDSRPRWAPLNGALMRRLWSVGGRPFLGSLAILAVYQIERWSIAAVLGPEALGRYYIVVLYSSLFVLVPAALMNVYFPKAMRALQTGDTAQFASFVRRHIIEVGAYLAVALLGTVVLVPSFIAMALPQFVGTENLILLAFIASTVFVMQDTGTLVLYATEQTTPIMIGCILALAAFGLTLTVASWLGSFTLETVVVARIVSALAGTAYLLICRQRALGKVGQ
jgi:O-antigen/teichoic acid export membrane protein